MMADVFTRHRGPLTLSIRVACLEARSWTLEWRTTTSESLRVLRVL